MNRYGAPTTYKRITPDRGCGFILKRIYELTEAPGLLPRPCPRKIDVYLNTRWYNSPGFASLLWSSLVKDGLIESNDGMQKYKYYSFWEHPHVGTRVAGHYERGRGYTVRYHLTPKGRGVLFDMMDRVNAKNKTQPKLNAVGSVAEYDAKKDGCPVKASEWRKDDFLLPGETKEEWAKRNGVTLLKQDAQRDIFKNMTRTDLIREYSNAAMEADRLDAQLLVHENDENGFARDRISAAYNNVCTRRDALAKEIERREKNETHDILKKKAVDCANLAADYIGETQKLRAEKNNLNERLKKIAARLEWLDDEISIIRNGLAEIIGQ